MGFQHTCVAGEDEDIALHIHERRVPLQQCLGGGDVGGGDTQRGIHGCTGDRFGGSDALRDYGLGAGRASCGPASLSRHTFTYRGNFTALVGEWHVVACTAPLSGFAFHCLPDTQSGELRFFRF